MKSVRTTNNSSKATGLDLLSPTFIKDGAKLIASPLTHILHLPLATGEIPVNLKSAKVVPIYKMNSKMEAGNYRPISILNTKLFERIVYQQISRCGVVGVVVVVVVVRR